MASTILEQEIQRRLSHIRALVRVHDRGVVLGFLFGLFPIFPLALCGLGLGLFHLRMFKRGKLSAFDYRLVTKGLYFAVVNSILSLALLALVIYVASNVGWGDLVDQVHYKLQDLLQFIWGKARSTGGRSVMT